MQSEVSPKDKHQYSILTYIYGILKDGNDNPICKTEKETQMYREAFKNMQYCPHPLASSQMLIYSESLGMGPRNHTSLSLPGDSNMYVGLRIIIL